MKPVKCDDCMLVLAQAKGDGPAALSAKWKRAVRTPDGLTDFLLCFHHAAARRIDDGLDPFKD